MGTVELKWFVFRTVLQIRDSPRDVPGFGSATSHLLHPPAVNVTLCEEPLIVLIDLFELFLHLPHRRPTFLVVRVSREAAKGYPSVNIVRPPINERRPQNGPKPVLRWLDVQGTSGRLIDAQAPLDLTPEIPRPPIKLSVSIAPNVAVHHRVLAPTLLSLGLATGGGLLATGGPSPGDVIIVNVIQVVLRSFQHLGAGFAHTRR